VAPKTCTACNGTGRVTRSTRKEKEHIVFQQVSICPACHGRGSMIEHPCPECQGRGNVEQGESFTVTIPPGIEEGMALRIPGKGMARLEAGSANGDLFVVVRTRRDPRFERAGADLLRQYTISPMDAVLGTTLEVPTLDGSVSVTVSPGIQPGEVLRIRGKGLPEFGSDCHGELYLRIEVAIPAHITREERDLYKRLRAIEKERDDSFLTGK